MFHSTLSKRTTISRSLIVTALAATLLAVSGPSASARTDGPPSPDLDQTAAVFDPSSPVTANWTRAKALTIEQDDTNTKPLIEPGFPMSA